MRQLGLILRIKLWNKFHITISRILVFSAFLLKNAIKKLYMQNFNIKISQLSFLIVHFFYCV